MRVNHPPGAEPSLRRVVGKSAGRRQHQTVKEGVGEVVLDSTHSIYRIESAGSVVGLPELGPPPLPYSTGYIGYRSAHVASLIRRLFLCGMFLRISVVPFRCSAFLLLSLAGSPIYVVQPVFALAASYTHEPAI
jgi:hypothetical protein